MIINPVTTVKMDFAVVIRINSSFFKNTTIAKAAAIIYKREEIRNTYVQILIHAIGLAKA